MRTCLPRLLAVGDSEIAPLTSHDLVCLCFFFFLFFSFLFSHPAFDYFDTQCRWAFHSGLEFLAEKTVLGHSYLFCLSHRKATTWRCRFCLHIPIGTSLILITTIDLPCYCFNVDYHSFIKPITGLADYLTPVLSAKSKNI